MGYDANVTRMFLDGNVQHVEGQQFLRGKGLAGETFPRVHRVEPHGFTSHPVAGGIATLMQARANRDSLYAMGGANPDLVPQLEQGGAAIYDQYGSVIKVVQRNVNIVAQTVTITAATIVLDGDVKLGGPGANRPASAKGTVDTAGAEDIGNLATKVWVI